MPKAGTENLGAKKITLHHTKDLMVLAFHPTQRMVAAGDVTGRILIWRGFGNRTFPDSGEEEASKKSFGSDEDKPGVRGNDDADSCSTRHWHPSEVIVLSFSSDGAYLYSGKMLTNNNCKWEYILELLIEKYDFIYKFDNEILGGSSLGK